MTDESTTTQTKPTGAGPWYIASAVAIGVSVDTSWRFFGGNLHITDLRERVILFAVLEITMVAAGWSMRAGVRRSGNPGSARLVAWALCGFSAYMALELSGPAEGLARVMLGPVLALVALHQALGIEIKTRIGHRTGTWARVGREMRERALSRLGLGDDQRDAKLRSQQRAAVQAATIATSRKVNLGKLRKQVLRAGPGQRELIMDTVAALKHLDKLVDVAVDNPWTSVQPVPVPSVPRPRPARKDNYPTSGGPSREWDADKVVAAMLAGQDVSGLVSVKNAQRVRRVLSALAAGTPVGDLIKGDITFSLATAVHDAREKAMAS